MKMPLKTFSRLLLALGVAGAGVLSFGCEAPAHAAVVKCSSANLMDVAVKQDCAVSVEQFSEQTSATIKVNTKRRQAHVVGDFTVAQGTVRIELRGSTGTDAEVTVTPEAPASFESTLRLNRNDSSFRLRFYPEGEVTGLTGTVSYEAR
ncbi:MAG TPA: hypothetical protein VK013_13860 [Myxococcaceae bacterium]|nr:hypothetical protein [Myxococcaceae bacterium]